MFSHNLHYSSLPQVTRVRSKTVSIKQLKPLSRDRVRVYPNDEIDCHHSDEPRLFCDEPNNTSSTTESFEEVPDMDQVFDDSLQRREYLGNDDNKNKVTLTRFLNAGILTAVVYGVQKKFRGKGKRWWV